LLGASEAYQACAWLIKYLDVVGEFQVVGKGEGMGTGDISRQGDISVDC
jgi:hypothetical protein